MKKMLLLIVLISGLSFAQNNQNNNRRAKAAVAATLSFIETELPAKYDNLMRLKNRNPKRFKRMMTSLTRRYVVIEKLKNSNSDSYEPAVQNFKIEITIQELKAQFKNSDNDEEKTELKIKIKKLLEQSFVAKMTITANEIKRLEEKLKENKIKLERRLKNKDKAIEIRLEQLLNEDIQW